MSIFDLENNKSISLEEFQISHEMIQPQLNDEVIPLYLKEFDSITNYITEKKAWNNTKLMKDPEYKKYIAALEEITAKRFGFKIKIIDGGSCPAACFPIPPKEFNVLTNRNNEDMYNYIKKKRHKMIKYEDPIEYEVVMKCYDSIKAINETLNAKGFKIDLQKAKIIGLPDSYCLAMLFNFPQLVNMGMNSRYILAIFLHEIGHCFTHLESSYRYLSNTTVLLDTFIYNLSNKNKTPRESLTIAYKKVSGDKSVDELRDTNKLTYYITMGKRYTDFIYAANTPHSYTDSEQQADQFAGRFGLGEELAKSLAILYKSNNGYKSMFLYFTIGTLGTISCICAPILTYLIGPIVVISFVHLYMSIFKKNNAYMGHTYDDDVQRLKRIRNESVRLLRSSNLDKDLISNIISQLDNIDDIIDDSREGFLGPIDKIYQTLFSSGKHKLELKTLEELTEKLMENDLHIAKHKIDLLGKN